MRLVFMAFLGAVVMTILAMGTRIVWRSIRPPVVVVQEDKHRPWLQTWNGRFFLVMLVAMLIAMGIHRMLTVQESPNNLERPPSREATSGETRPQPIGK